MRRYPAKPKSALDAWLRFATPEMREDLCKRVGCPLNSLQALAYGNRKMPRLDRGVTIVESCNAIRQEMVDRMPTLQDDPDTSAIIPPLMKLQDLIDGASRDDR